MNFLKLEHLQFLSAFFALFVLLDLVYRYYFYKWVRSYWLLRPKILTRFSTFLYLLALLILMSSLLDLRGAPLKHQASLPEQYTIIALDLSASMDAEDITPSRLKRSILLARQFVKRSIGQKVAIYLFSEMAFNLVPFTDDIDYLDARLDALSTLPILKGGTDINGALATINKELKQDHLTANIVLFTDGEETVRSGTTALSQLKPYIVLVGNSEGAKIPQRDESGNFLSYKRNGGKEILTTKTQMYVNTIKESRGNIYDGNKSLDIIDKIVTKMEKDFVLKIEKDNIVVRKAYGPYLIILAVFLFLLSKMLLWGRVFKTLSLLLCVMIGSSHVVASEEAAGLSKNPTREEIFLYATKILREIDRTTDAATLFSEGAPTESDSCEILINTITSLYKDKRILEGLSLYEKWVDSITSKKCQETLYQNTSLAMLNYQSSGGENKKGGTTGESTNSESSTGNEKSEGKGNKKSETKGKGERKKESVKEPGDSPNENPPPENYQQKQARIKKAYHMVKGSALQKKVSDEDKTLQGKFIQIINKKNNKERSGNNW